MLSNFDLEELANEKSRIRSNIRINWWRTSTAQPLRAFILLNEGLTIKQEHQEYSFYQV